MKTLLSVIHGPTFGGAHNQAARLSPCLRDAGWQTIVALPSEAIAASQRLMSAGVETHRIPLARLRATTELSAHARLLTGFWPSVQQLRQLIRRYQADVVQVHGLTNPHAALAGRLEGIAVVWQLLDTRPPRPLRTAGMPLVRALADVVMTTGQTVADSYPGVRRLDDRLYTFIPPVDIGEFRPNANKRLRARRLMGATDSDFVVGALCNRNPQKGLEILLAAGAMVQRAAAQRIILRIYGSVSPNHIDYDRQLHVRAMALGFDEASIGEVPDGYAPSDILNGFDVLAMSSVPLSEGIPTVILEAMACGLPIVSSDVGGVREVIEDGRDGLLVPPNSPRLLASALERVATSQPLRASLSARARSKVADRWAALACARTHIDAYEAAMDRARARHGL